MLILKFKTRESQLLTVAMAPVLSYGLSLAVITKFCVFRRKTNNNGLDHLNYDNIQAFRTESAAVS